MKLFLALLLFLLPVVSQAQQQEHVILCGGPALLKWENLRVQPDRHDRWWANFIRASTIRMDELRKAYGPTAKLVWIVYKDGYVDRGKEDRKPYTTWIQEQAAKRSASLIWVNSGGEAIAALNNRPTRSVVTFDYFGHSNKFCFMLDYGSDVMAVSQAWIHENDLPKIKRSIFARRAVCQSYGCHTGESMSKRWNALMGNVLIGASGKTDYVPVGQGKLPVVNGTWLR